MPRVKIIKDYKEYKSGETHEVTPNIAHGLVNKGVAMLSKDMEQSDQHTKVMTKKRSKRGKSA